MKLQITLVKSSIGAIPKHRKTVEALGLRKLHQTVVKEKSGMILGMVASVSYMLKVEEVKG